ncbi:MAG: segregation/condensation protein A [Candidatus Micrarchaeota archaeon]
MFLSNPPREEKKGFTGSVSRRRLKNMDLLDVIQQPTWREFLTDLIAREKMDPWDVDLVQVADAYLVEVRKMQALDLRIPANVILASALLLRFKADAITFEDVTEEAVEERVLFSEELPELVLRPTRPRSRHVTLEELVKAVESVMRDGRKVMRVSSQPIAINIELPQRSMGERMLDVYGRVLQMQDSEGVVLFSQLVSQDYSQVAFMLLPILHLAQDERILAWQDEVFGDIFIRVIPDSKDAPALQTE